MAQLEIDTRTARALEFAARMANVTPAQLVARLVDQASLPTPCGEAGGSPPSTAAEHRVAIYADYEGFRTRALFDPGTSRVDITSGPLEGRSHKSPTGAARAVVGHYSPPSARAATAGRSGPSMTGAAARYKASGVAEPVGESVRGGQRDQHVLPRGGVDERASQAMSWSAYVDESQPESAGRPGRIPAHRSRRRPRGATSLVIVRVDLQASSERRRRLCLRRLLCEEVRAVAAGCRVKSG